MAKFRSNILADRAAAASEALRLAYSDLPVNRRTLGFALESALEALERVRDLARANAKDEQLFLKGGRPGIDFGAFDYEEGDESYGRKFVA